MKTTEWKKHTKNKIIQKAIIKMKHYSLFMFLGRRDKMNKKWWKCAGIRAIKTICQTAVATIGTATVMEDVNWIMILSASLLAGILSLLTSIAGLPEVKVGENND